MPTAVNFYFCLDIYSCIVTAILLLYSHQICSMIRKIDSEIHVTSYQLNVVEMIEVFFSFRVTLLQ